ncbi:metallophosphoesterase [Janthinobacterium sp. Mn2066]|uniref:metallophosphoesterase n=1 Tax=Janthinobacterium sp. Mn2066 TaxID=3395264 RepID=UPI003BE6FFDE
MAAIFVHLSDIHFGQEKRVGDLIVNKDARHKLIQDASAVIAGLPGKKAAGVIVTGDIAYAGKRHEYDDAGNWLDELTESIGCTAADIQMVPGNHDVDRSTIKGMSELVLNAIHDGGEARLDSFLELESDRDLLYVRFAEYRRFADAYQCPLDCDGKNTAERRVELRPGRAIRFVRLNSALICTKDREEYGKLLLGARQRVLTDSIGEELVVLAHHPLAWYSDAADMTKFLRGRARVFISGHEHLAAVNIQNVEPGRDLMMLAAGATTPDKLDGTYTYAYNIIEFDWDEAEDALAVTLHARAWNDEMKRFECDDKRLGGKDSRIVLGSPNFLMAPKPAVPFASVPIDSSRVEIIQPPKKVTVVGKVDESAYQNIYLRFFRDLAEGERLRIFFELNALPSEISGRLNHEMEGKFLRSIVDANRFEELQEKVEYALERRETLREEHE